MRLMDELAKALEEHQKVLVLVDTTAEEVNFFSLAKAAYPRCKVWSPGAYYEPLMKPEAVIEVQSTSYFLSHICRTYGHHVDSDPAESVWFLRLMRDCPRIRRHLSLSRQAIIGCAMVADAVLGGRR